ncbi:hypothetical protein BB560_002203 [Smittium megazygosporum]|uniref:dolichol kinase n=1 Tax=Smittium megazygosporum TaxID=133381 RepID=A0A2T9ZFM1_9FUNG|nr:hypothetical protein BB560_002203 [Smittium megazygosporum]
MNKYDQIQGFRRNMGPLLPLFLSGFVTYFGLILKTGTDPIFWILNFVFRDTLNFGVVIYCILVLLVFTLIYQRYLSELDSFNSKFLLYMRRKYFHLLIIFLIVPPLYVSPTTCSLSLSFAFFGMCVSEFVRVLDFGGFGKQISEFYKSSLDEKDSGKLAMSHIYLLFGCAFPIWIENNFSVQALSGVLAVGIGDAVASIIGIKFGRHRWFGSKKSIEGTLGFICSILASSLCIEYFANPSNKFTFQKAIIS